MMVIEKTEDPTKSRVMQKHTLRHKQSVSNFLYTSMQRQYVQLKDDHREKSL